MKPSIKITAIVLVAIAAIAAILYLGLSRSKNSVPEVSTGTLERYPDFPSKHIDKRTVSVWLPEGYTQGAPFDVLYMHDGQMLFDAKTTWNHQEWMVDEVLGSMIGAGEMRPCIVVAVDNTNDRLMEYFPDKAANYLEAKPDSFTPKGDAYLRFLVEELKPFIDDTYQPLSSREHTFLMGSSMGGLISLYALCEYPEVFGGAACLSTHSSMAHLLKGADAELADGLRSYLKAHLPAPNSALLYMDFGSEGYDAAYAPTQQEIDKIIREAGWDDSHYESLVFEGHDHNEKCWSERLDIPLSFLLPDN